MIDKKIYIAKLEQTALKNLMYKAASEYNKAYGYPEKYRVSPEEVQDLIGNNMEWIKSGILAGILATLEHYVETNGDLIAEPKEVGILIGPKEEKIKTKPTKKAKKTKKESHATKKEQPKKDPVKEMINRWSKW